MSERKRCTVVYATPARQYLWQLELPAAASVQDALAAARAQAGTLSEASAEIPWETAEVGIFGEPCGRDVVPRDADRIEIYRPLSKDPKESRRQRVQRARAAARSGR